MYCSGLPASAMAKTGSLSSAAVIADAAAAEAAASLAAFSLKTRFSAIAALRMASSSSSAGFLAPCGGAVDAMAS